MPAFPQPSNDFQRITKVDAANTLAIDFDLLGFDEYQVRMRACRPVSDSVNWYCYVSRDGGVSFDSTNGEYGHQFMLGKNSGLSALRDETYLAFPITGVNATTGNVVPESMEADFTITNAGRSDEYTRFHSKYSPMDGSNNHQIGECVGARHIVDVVNAIRIKASTGNILSGEISLWGYKYS